MSKLTFYRYETYKYDTSHIILRKFHSIRETKKGHWIVDNYTPHYSEFKMYDGIKKWVNNTSFKRYAYLDIDQAWENFKARRNKYNQILKNRLSDNKIILELIKNGKPKENKKNIYLA